jgi:hypothetical protein
MNDPISSLAPARLASRPRWNCRVSASGAAHRQNAPFFRKLSALRIARLNSSPNRFRQLGEFGLEFRTGLQNLREFRGLRPQGINWFQ